MQLRILLLWICFIPVCIGFTGCNEVENQPPEPDTSHTPYEEPQSQSSYTADDLYSAYRQKYDDLVSEYGEASAFSNADDIREPSYLEGVCIVELIDFNGDGIEDMLVVYSNKS